MDEKLIADLNGQIRENSAAEATARAAADKVLADMRSAGVDPLSNENLPKLSEAYKSADALKARGADLKSALDSALGVVADRGAESRPTSDAGRAGSAAMRFLASAEYRGMIDSGRLRHTGSRIDTMPVEVLEREAMLNGARLRLFDNSANVGSGLLTPDYTGKMVEVLTRRVRLLDLITTGRTDTDTVDWISENARTDNAAETSFGTAIPESNYGFKHNTTTVKRVGHFVTATRGILADAGQSRTLIDNRLMSGLDRRIEAQVYGGDGVGENLKGINTYSGTLSQAVGTDYRADAVHKAMTKIRVATESQVEPTALAISPNDYEKLVLEKDANGNYIFGKPDTNIAPSIWGLTPVVTTLVSDGAPQIADYAEAATLWLREGAFIATSDSHSDYFLKGLIAIKVETRLAFALTRPEAVCKLSGF